MPLKRQPEICAQGHIKFPDADCMRYLRDPAEAVMCTEPLGLLISVRQCAWIWHLDVFAKFHIPFWSVWNGHFEFSAKLHIPFLECVEWNYVFYGIPHSIDCVKWIVEFFC